MRVRICTLLAAAIAVSLAAQGPSNAADWPMWRYDAGRTAGSPQELRGDLHLQWTIDYPKLDPAWPDEDRMIFDTSYEPVVLGKTVYIASPRSDSVTALSTRTGEMKWRFYTDGPIRLAPAAWNGKLYVGSDDGYLYCLDAESGEVLWRFRGARSDRKVLGNKRLISTWPVRGGPVVMDSKVYFAAGIWPFMGVFVHALDADTGAVIWTNDGCGSLYIDQPHNSAAFGGIAPQGYVVASGKYLMVPNGRAAPGGFNRETGQYLYFHLAQNKHNGDSRIVANERYFFGCDFASACETGEGRIEMKEEPVIDGNTGYIIRDSSIVALDISKLNAEEIINRKGETERRVFFRELWSSPTDAQRIWLKAGSRLFAAKDHTVLAIDLPNQNSEGKVTWSAELDDAPSSMAAADDRLFVVTSNGRIHCFGTEKLQPATAVVPQDGAAKADKWTKTAAGILSSTGITEGYCLAFGIGSGRLVEELAMQSDLRIVVFDPDPKKVDLVRRRWDAMGLYGSQVAAHVGTPMDVDLPPYMASLIVSEDTASAGIGMERQFVSDVFACLRPYGGTACLSLTANTAASLKQWVSDARLVNAIISGVGQFTMLTRQGALPGSDDWTHQYADAANTVVSNDELVQLPLGLLWFGGSSNKRILPRHGHGPSEQVVAGRLFIEGPNELRALDVYTGRVLWERSFPGLGKPYDNTSHQPGANSLGSNYVSVEDGIYVVYQREILRLDPATGKTLSKFSLPEDVADPDSALVWGKFCVWEDMLISGLDPQIFDDAKMGQGNWNATSSARLAALNRYTGDLIWIKESEYGFRHNTIAAGAGKVFCIDRLPDEIVDRMKRRGELTDTTPRLLVLDARSGDLVWEKTKDVFGTWLGYSQEYDTLIQSGRASRDMLGDEPKSPMIAYNADNGDVLWRHEEQYDGPPLLHGDTIVTQGAAYSILTGERVMRTNLLTGRQEPWKFNRNYGCNTAIASEHLLTFRSAAAGYYDFTNDGGTGNFGGFKSGCTSNLIAANGVLNAPDYTRTCTCSYQNQTSLALVHTPGVATWTFASFERGEGPIKQVGINFGAPGDHLAEDGVLWLDCPSVGGASPEVPVAVEGENVSYYRHDTSIVDGGVWPWAGASGVEGAQKITITLDPQAEETRAYTVRLCFCETEGMQVGQRVIAVGLQGSTVLAGFDVAKEAGGVNQTVVREFTGIEIQKDLAITLDAAGGSSILCGVEITAEGW